MLVGAHVRGGGPLAEVVGRGAALGAQAVQIFTQSPRMWRPSRHSPQSIDQLREAMAGQDQVQALFCHATYLVNLATADPELLARSKACLVDNFAVATAMGADGLVLHVGSHRGAGLAGCLDQVATSLAGTLDAVDPLPGGSSCPILVENAAGAGGTIGRDLDELATIVERVGSDRIGVCLDTQHLWASGVDFSTLEGADEVVARLDDGVGLDRLRCIHLNDSAVAFGANRDRHANIGAGTIGADGLAALLGHPDLQAVPAVLEVPGDGSGPTAEQVQLAKEVVANGVARRSQ